MKKVNYSIIIITILLCFTNCTNRQKKLPILSKFTIENKDTIYQLIQDFELITQDNINFDSKSLKGKIHVADFFFTSCPGICTVMTKQMQRLQEMTKNIPNLQLVSFTVDPARDNPKKLKEYGIQHRADFERWTFLTGEMDYIHNIGIKGYYLGMQKDDNEPGGYLHSGKFVLIDTQGLIRGYYDGTNANDISLLARDLKHLIAENE